MALNVTTKKLSICPVTHNIYIRLSLTHDRTNQRMHHLMMNYQRNVNKSAQKTFIGSREC